MDVGVAVVLRSATNTYSAPEVVAWDEHPDTASPYGLDSDLYTVGVVLRELCERCDVRSEEDKGVCGEVVRVATTLMSEVPGERGAAISVSPRGGPAGGSSGGL